MPAVTWVAFEIPDTGTGVVLFVVVPFPSSPLAPDPQLSTCPVESNAHE